GDGYPASRKRLLAFLQNKNVKNPVVIGGGAHAFGVANLHRVFDPPQSKLVASEFCTTSVTSELAGVGTGDRVNDLVGKNPHVRFADEHPSPAFTQSSTLNVVPRIPIVAVLVFTSNLARLREPTSPVTMRRPPCSNVTANESSAGLSCW